jgi:hypothetical protein
MDLLGLDGLGNLVIVELKRDKLPREALAQAIDYASDVADWSVEKISEMCSDYIGQSLEDYVAENFSEQNLEIVNINTSQRIMLVGFAIESSLERMINWLSDSYNVDVNAVVLHYVKTSSGDELLTKTAVISEEVAEERAKKKKFQIPMSDEPGTYEEEELKTLLIKYLSKHIYSARRILKVVIPACLEHGVLTREQLKEEFVKRGEAEDTSQAGYFLVLVSGQMGMKKNDFLRQVIRYEYPRHAWEKDNYSIREGFQDLVREVLQELREDDEIPDEGERLTA